MSGINAVLKDRLADSFGNKPQIAYERASQALAKAKAKDEPYLRDPETEAHLLSGFSAPSDDNATSRDLKNRISSWKFGALYAMEMMTDRWSEFEKAVEASPTNEDRTCISAVFSYTKYHGGRWKDAERHIATDPHYSLRYAFEIKGRRLDDDDPIHKAIMSETTTADRYEARFPKNDEILSARGIR